MLNSLIRTSSNIWKEHLKISVDNPSRPGLLSDFKEDITDFNSSIEKGQSNISF